MNRQDMSDILIQLRKEHGYTQASLAEQLGISYQAVSKWERGENLPDAYTLLALADIYHVTVDELLRGQLKDKDVIQKVLRRKWILFIVAITLLVLSPTSIFIVGVINYEVYVPIILMVAAVAIPLILYATVSSEQLIHSSKEAFTHTKNNEIVYTIAAGIFLTLGFVWNLWHPGWIIFVFAYSTTLIVQQKESKKDSSS